MEDKENGKTEEAERDGRNKGSWDLNRTFDSNANLKKKMVMTSFKMRDPSPWLANFSTSNKILELGDINSPDFYQMQ